MGTLQHIGGLHRAEKSKEIEIDKAYFGVIIIVE